MQRTIFLISDRTGITVETLVHSLMTQFDDQPARRVTLPFVDSDEKVNVAVQQINSAKEEDGVPPIIFSSLVDGAHREALKRTGGVVFDLFEDFLARLEQVMGTRGRHEPGLSHGQGNQNQYDDRVDAVNFALNYDDGIKLSNLEQAEVILVGVSRSGKTPTSLYLALHYGIYAANYPITDDDFERHRLPREIEQFKHKLFGLTISAQRLQRIREKRRPGSRYSEMRVCQREIQEAEEMFRRYGIPYMDTTSVSIEEIGSAVLHQTGLGRSRGGA